jgi:peptidoglycan hydrolase CwlO-like protein
MLNLKTFLIGTTLTVVSIGAFAQATATPATPATPRVDQREVNQEKRIDKGVASGQLNAKETHRLDKQQARIQVAQANAKADGKVTHGERKHLHKMQNRASKNIHAQKHDAQTAKP